MQKNKRAKRNKKNSKFTIIYVLCLLGAGVIGLFNKSFFAYDIFNSLWADILYLIFISLMFLTAFIHEIYESRAIGDVILNFFIFIVGLVSFLLVSVLGGIFVLVSLLFSAVMLAVIACRYSISLCKNHKAPVDIKHIIGVLIFPLIAMTQQMTVEYVNELFLAWALIPAAVIFGVAAIIAFILLKNDWLDICTTKVKSIFTAIGVGFLILIVAYSYSFTAIGVANCVFDGEPIEMEYVVMDKKVRSSYRNPTRFEIKVIIDSKERWIFVPATDYYEISEGDLVIIDYYSGALNFAYYAYCEKV